ncbi:hypothetical protein [Lysinibacillus fusiformis]|uniref:hypothetical protein n=1 Tax=Lysinibacillus fusiformis TaxID=28031 RepID=UPI001881ECC8|nr:hypothetical protein [Lysinibacillus fusiformis]MBD8521474.1 hypothetical protein [Lysinibacillus fusiformis]
MANYSGQQTIFDYLSRNSIPDGYHNFDVNGVSLDVQVVNKSGNYRFNGTETIGDAASDTHMLIFKVSGNLTIDSGKTLIPGDRKKGFCIYVTGMLINNGIISMTARGARAVGNDVYLYKDKGGKFEFVPAIGGKGGAGFYAPAGGTYGPNAGLAGVNRQTGGGASGQGNYGSPGGGAAGTSYSGGSGGGGAGYDSRVAGAATPNGGPGGNGAASRTNAGGGAGNPGGGGGATGQSGTGGLLIIYAGSIENNGIIEAKGVNGAGWPIGGGSGGGSINLFYATSYKAGTITAVGGNSAGAGSITATRITLVQHVTFIHINNELLLIGPNELAPCDLSSIADFKRFAEAHNGNIGFLSRQEFNSMISMQKEVDGML